MAFMALCCALALTLLLPTNALALTTNKATARPNQDGGSGVIGGLTTRLTWEGTVDEGEEVSSITLMLPVGGTYTMTAEEAAEAALRMDIQTAVPTHFADIVGTPLDGPRFTKLFEEGRRK